MTAAIFVDTNVLLYALDAGDRKKQQAAQAWRTELWRSRRGRVSFQILQEFYVKATQKWPASRDDARAEVQDLLAWDPVTIDAKVMENGWRIQDRYRFSFWDALVVSAAKTASCEYLLTEDLQAGQEVDGIMIVNPFLSNPASLP